MLNTLEKQGIRQTRRCKNKPLMKAQALSLLDAKIRLLKQMKQERP